MAKRAEGMRRGRMDRWLPGRAFIRLPVCIPGDQPQG